MGKKSSIYDRYKTDKRIETSGVWFDYGDMGRFLVARAGGANSEYSRMLSKKMKVYRNQIDSGNIPEDVLRKVTANIFAETVVLNWEDVHDEKGKVMPYSKENCEKLLVDLPDFFDDISAFAIQYSNFQITEMDEADAKN